MSDPLAIAVRQLGRDLLDWRAAGRTAYTREGTQFKAEADARAHDELTAHLHRLYPGVAVVSEEDAESLVSDPRGPYWLTDPIDGTASYVQGFPGFVVQLALIDQAGPSVAYVYAPATDELFTATLGGGAFVNGRRLNCAPTGRQVLIDNYPEARGIAAEAMKALGMTTYVESGSLGLKVCRVADGGADLFLKDVVVRDWDMAPGDLILAEAGGILTDLAGVPFSWGGSRTHQGIIATTTAALHQQVLAWGSTFRRGKRDSGNGQIQGH